MTDCAGVSISLQREEQGRKCAFFVFLSATEYHSDADYNSRQVCVVVVVVVVVVVDHNFKNGLTFERLDRFASYLEGS